MINVDVSNVINRIESQLGAFEITLNLAHRRITRIEKHLNERIQHVRDCIKKMGQTKDIKIIIKIADTLNYIERIINKLDEIDIGSPILKEVSLESIMNYPLP